MTTIKELKKICKDKGIKGYSKLSKKELEKLCLKKYTENQIIDSLEYIMSGYNYDSIYYYKSVQYNNFIAKKLYELVDKGILTDINLNKRIGSVKLEKIDDYNGFGYIHKIIIPAKYKKKKYMIPFDDIDIQPPFSGIFSRSNIRFTYIIPKDYNTLDWYLEKGKFWQKKMRINMIKKKYKNNFKKYDTARKIDDKINEYHNFWEYSTGYLQELFSDHYYDDRDYLDYNQMVYEYQMDYMTHISEELYFFQQKNLVLFDLENLYCDVEFAKNKHNKEVFRFFLIIPVKNPKKDKIDRRISRENKKGKDYSFNIEYRYDKMIIIFDIIRDQRKWYPDDPEWQRLFRRD